VYPYPGNLPSLGLAIDFRKTCCIENRETNFDICYFAFHVWFRKKGVCMQIEIQQNTAAVE